MAVSRKQREATEAIEELSEALDAADEAPEPSEARLRFLNGEITWRQLIEAGG